MDPRVVVDLRWYGGVQPQRDNRICFSKKIKDQYGMPQPTFHFRLSDDDIKLTHDMMHDMIKVARTLGGYLSTYLAPNLSI